MLIGQEYANKMIQHAVKRGRLAHAYLIHGQKGTGKDAFAISISKGLLCGGDAWSGGGCGSCIPCTQVAGLNHPDFHLILPVPTKPDKMKEDQYYSILRRQALARIENPYMPVSYTPDLTTAPVISIDQVRSIKKIVMLKPARGAKRIFIISNAEAMTDEAANSLLKLLEEPPEQTYFFLTAESPAGLHQTIVSRCQLFHLKSLSAEQIKDALIDRWSFEPGKADFLSKMAGGSLQKALLLANESIEELRQDALEFLTVIIKGRHLSALDCIDRLVLQRDRENMVEVLHFTELILRDFFILQQNYPNSVIQTDQLDEIHQLVKISPGFKTEQALSHTAGAIDSIKKNAYLPLVLFSLSEELRRCNENN